MDQMSFARKNYQAKQKDHNYQPSICTMPVQQQKLYYQNLNNKQIIYNIPMQSSPSFCTDENNQFDIDFNDTFNLTSHQSQISQFGSSYLIFTQQQQSKQLSNQTHQQKIQSLITQQQQQNQYIPSLNSYYSNSLKQIDQSQSGIYFQKGNNLNSLQSVQLKSNQMFIPDIKNLTQHISFLENQVYIHKKQFLRMKSFNQAIINAVKTMLSQEVGKQLEKYMDKNFVTSELNQFIKCGQGIQSYSQQMSKQYLSKLSSQSLSYSMQMNSKQMSKNIQQIFTLGSSKFSFKDKQSSKDKLQLIECKTTQKKNNISKKTKIDKQNKQNIPYKLYHNQKDTQSKQKDAQQLKRKDKKFIKKRKQLFDQNESMKFLMNDNVSTCKSSNITTPRSSFFNIKSNNSHIIATQLLCEVCDISYQPNQFFKHINKCSNQNSNFSSQQLKSTQKLAFNYTIMMQKLFLMRQQIQTQIQILSVSKQKQKSKQKSKQKQRIQLNKKCKQITQRQKLKLKLQQDLYKVTKIIQEKQKQMQSYMSKNIQNQKLKQSIKFHLKYKQIK